GVDGAGRGPTAADLQPGRRLRELRRAGGVRVDPAADVADRRVHAHRRGAGAAWRRGGRDRARARYRPPDNLFARARALLNRAAALLRFLHPWPAAAIIRAGVGLRSRDQLNGPGGGCLVQASRDSDAHLPRHQPSAVLPGGIFLAARSNPKTRACRRLHIPVGSRDRRHGPDRSVWRQPVGGGARLARTVGPRRRLLRARGDVRVFSQAEAVSCFSRRSAGLIALGLIVLAAPRNTANAAARRSGASGGQRGDIIITPRVENDRDTRDAIRHVVVPVRRMIDAVLAGASHAALKAADLGHQPIVAR